MNFKKLDKIVSDKALSKTERIHAITEALVEAGTDVTTCAEMLYILQLNFNELERAKHDTNKLLLEFRDGSRVVKMEEALISIGAIFNYANLHEFMSHEDKTHIMDSLLDVSVTNTRGNKLMLGAIHMSVFQLAAQIMDEHQRLHNAHASTIVREILFNLDHKSDVDNSE